MSLAPISLVFVCVLRARFLFFFWFSIDTVEAGQWRYYFMSRAAPIHFVDR